VRKALLGPYIFSLAAVPQVLFALDVDRPHMGQLQDAGFEIGHIAAAETSENEAWVFFMTKGNETYYCPLMPPMGMGTFFLGDETEWLQSVSCARFAVSVEAELLKEND